MKKASVLRVVLVGILVTFSANAWLRAGDTFECKQAVDAYDVNHPAQLIGRFEPPTTLEVEEYVAAAKMFRVLYKAPDGKEIRALCRPDALGRKPPEAPKTGFPSTPPATPPATSTSSSPSTDSSQPPLFAALEQFAADVWETPSSKFALQQSSFGFKWVSLAENNESRWAQLPGAQPIKFLGKPLCESIVRFKSDRPEEIRLLFFNRGDAKKDLEESEFNSLMKDMETSLDQWMGAKGVDAWIAGNVANTKRKSWFKRPLRADLEWSLTRNAVERDGGMEVHKPFRAEFVRLVITTYDGKTDIASLIKPNFQVQQVTTARSKDLKERVKREANGDVYLDGIPMVDQGQKGYCVVAAVERVMRYFGLDVDQNEIAKVANTATEGGTSPDAMYKALKKICGQFSLVVRELIGFDIKDFLKEVDGYNRVARKNKKREIVLPTSGMINLTAIWDSMDLDSLREVRLKRANDKTKFVKDIAAAIEKGAPLLWSVEVGWVEETPALPQTRGGHMRLIIGYNEKTSEIIYSDTWGAGHELKKMKVDDAFFITHGLYTVMPGS